MGNEPANEKSLHASDQCAVRCLKLEIIKPLNRDWQDVGPLLRRLARANMLLANAISACYFRADTELYQKPTVNEKGYIEFPKKPDSKKLDIPKVDAAIEKEVNALVRAKAPFLATRVVGYAIKDVGTRYKQSRFDIARGAARIPHYRSYPIMTDKYSLFKTPQGFEIEVGFLSEIADEQEFGDLGRIRFVLNSRKLNETDRDTLTRIVEGLDGRMAIKLTFLERKNKWFFNIPVQRPVRRTEAIPDRKLYVYPPGNGKMLRMRVVVKEPPTRPEHIWQEDLEYDSAIQFRKAYEARARMVSMKYRQDESTGAIGHGRSRALAKKSEYQDKYRRAARTHNQQRAAHVIKRAVQWKCASVAFLSPDLVPIEGYNLLSSWPWFELEQCIKNKCEENSLGFEKLIFDAAILDSWEKKLEEASLAVA